MSHAKHRQIREIREIRVQNKIFVLLELFVFKKNLDMWGLLFEHELNELNEYFFIREPCEASADPLSMLKSKYFDHYF